MNPITVGLTGIGALFLLLASGVPVGFAIGLVGFVGFGYLSTLDASLSIMGIVPHSTSATYDMCVIPFFMLMGQLALHGRLTKNLYRAGHKWLGHLPGGLAMATIGACAGFAAICGSTVATAATMSEVAIPEMKRYKYASSLAAGCVAAGGGLGILIPPSAIFVLYGILAQESIGRLFAAGIIPGIVLSVLHMITIYVWVKINPRLAPPVPNSGWKEKLIVLKDTWQVLLLFAVVMGGIWTGIFTATEAAAVGAFGAFVITLMNRGLTWQNLGDALKQTTQTTAMIFGYFMTVTKLPMELANWTAGLQLPRNLVFAVIIIIYLFLGCVMDSLAMVLLTVPIFLPVMNALGFDPIWFGVMVVMVVEMGVITPPVGMNVYVISGMNRDIPIEVIFKGIFPFLAAQAICIVLLLVFPQIALFLPNLLR